MRRPSSQRAGELLPGVMTRGEYQAAEALAVPALAAHVHRTSGCLFADSEMRGDLAPFAFVSVVLGKHEQA